MKRNTTNIQSDRAFRRTVRTFFKKHGRHDLPWRNIPRSLSVGTHAYRVLVSEIMLQQTQVLRVREKYAAFIKLFPTLSALAEAPLGEVLRAWQGLGYNRRAKMLHECAKTVMRGHKGKLPTSYEGLCSLPGVGPYTAGAVMAFAYNEPVVMIETNIRTVYLHHYFNDAVDVPDTAILSIIERTLDRRNPRAWYAALMDYGTYLKKEFGNANVRSMHYTKQSAFKGSDREIRGAVVRVLAQGMYTKKKLSDELHSFDDARLVNVLSDLLGEGLIKKEGRYYQLP